MNSWRKNSIIQIFFSKLLASFLHKAITHLELLVPVEPLSKEQVEEILQTEELLLSPVSGIKSLVHHVPNSKLFINGDELSTLTKQR